MSATPEGSSVDKVAAASLLRVEDAPYFAARARQARTWSRIRRAEGNFYDSRAAAAEARWYEQLVRNIADAAIAAATGEAK